MRTISTTEVRAQFSTLLNKVSSGKQRIRVKRKGKPLVAIVSLEDLEILEEIEDKIDILEANKSKKESLKKGTKSLDQVIKELYELGGKNEFLLALIASLEHRIK